MKFRILLFIITVFLQQKMLCQITLPGYDEVQPRDGRISRALESPLMPVNKETENLIYSSAKEEIDDLVALLTQEFGERFISVWIADEAVYRGATHCEVMWTKKINEKDTLIVVLTRSFLNRNELIKVAKIEKSTFFKKYSKVSLNRVFKDFQFVDLVNGTLFLQNDFVIKCIDLSDFSEYDIPKLRKIGSNYFLFSNFKGELDFDIENNAESIVYDKLYNLAKNNIKVGAKLSEQLVSNAFKYQEHNWYVSITNINNPFAVKKQIFLSDTVNDVSLRFEEVNSEWVIFLDVMNSSVDYTDVELKMKMRNNGVWRDMGLAVATKYSHSPGRTVYRLTPLNNRPISFLKLIGYSEDVAIADAANSVVFNTKSITCLVPLFYGAVALRDLSGSCHYVNCVVPNEGQQENLSPGVATGSANYAQGTPYVGGAAKIQGSASGGGNYQLGTRAALERTMPRYDCDVEGVVVVKVYVDRNGVVKRADGQGQKGSTTTNECLIRRAEEAALKTRWQIDYSGPELQVGTILYSFNRT